jgi:protein-S-isoprenylcysteine O-methyltransferase Ste14
MTLRFVLRFLFFFAFLAVLMFVPAGTADWPAAWVFLAEMAVGGGAICLWLARYDPGLLKERMGATLQKDQAPGDKVFMIFLQVFFYFWIVAMAVDAERWRLSDVPAWVNALGALLVPCFMVLCWLAFRENSFAAPVVKIQKERGQTVVSSGIYAFIRHPMYAGGLFYFIGLPMLLGSWIGLALAPILIGALLVRIRIEERALYQALPGYADYARDVPYRLVPGLW